MYLLARELTGRRDAAFLAGLMFAFSPLRALHVSHLQVLAWGWMPIALVGPAPVHGGGEDPSRIRAAWLAVFAAAFMLAGASRTATFSTTWRWRRRSS